MPPLSKRQLLKEMLDAHSTAKTVRAQQLGASEEPKSQKNQRVPDLLRSIPEAFRCVLASQSTVLYTTANSAGRPHLVWSQEVGGREGTLIFEEKDESCTVDVAVTRDGKYATINSNTRTSSEVHLLQTDRLTDAPLLVRAREPLVEYYVDHAHGHFYVFTNVGSDREYKVMLARDFSPQQWLEFYKPKDGFVLQDIELYERFVVLYGAKDLVPVVMVMDASDVSKELLVLCEEDACHIEKSHTTDFQSSSLSFWLSSPAHPPRLYTFSEQTLSVPDHPNGWESKYETDRHMVPCQDGSQVPLTLVYRRHLLRKDGSNPMMVLVYGCYGENLYMGYQPEKLCMLDRGWVLAYCHVRGGGELGRKWYHAGQGQNKQKTFEDLHACVEYLHRARYSQPLLTALHGSSAGGMAVGMFCNLWPQLVQAAILRVPFVNVIETLTDSSLYLSSKDYEEFGNPNISEENLNHILSVCPHSNLKPQDYPATLVWASRADDVIPFSGVEKYVKKLRRCVQQHRNTTSSHMSRRLDSSDKLYHRGSRIKSLIPRGSVLFHVDERHDHYSSDRSLHQKFEMVTMELAFLHKVLHLTLEQLYHEVC